jgi:hypothetical protein
MAVDRFAAVRPLLLPILLIVIALSAFNLRISGEMEDFEAYRGAGGGMLAGAPLYQGTDHPFTALPALAVVMVPFALITAETARVAWYALSCASLVLLLRWSVLALPERRWSERSLIIVTLALLAKFYAVELTLGQSDLLLGVLLMAGLGALQLEAPKAAAMGFAAAVFFKPQALILLPWLIASHGMGPGSVAIAGLAAGLVLPAVFYGWSGNLGLLANWWPLATDFTSANLAGDGHVSLASLWANALGPGTIAGVLTACSILLLLAVGATMWRQRARVAEPDYVEFAFLLMLIPLIAPGGRDYVLLLATPAIVCVTDRWRELRLPWQAASGIALTIIGLSAFSPASAFPVVAVCAVVTAATLAQIRVRALG